MRARFGITKSRAGHYAVWASNSIGTYSGISSLARAQRILEAARAAVEAAPDRATAVEAFDDACRENDY